MKVSKKRQPAREITQTYVERSAVFEEIRGAAREADSEVAAESAARRQREAEADPALLAARLRRRHLISMTVIYTACLALTTFNLSGLGLARLRHPADPAGDTDLRMRSTLYMAVMDIESFRQEHGSLPASPAEADLPALVQWNYQILEGGRYRISVSEGERTMTYDSILTPDEHFAGLAKVFRRPARP